MVMTRNFLFFLLIFSFIGALWLGSSLGKAGGVQVAYAQSSSTTTDTAEGDVSPPEIKIHPVIGFSSINQAVGTLIGFAFLGGAALAFYFIVMGAIKYISAGENPNNTTAARQTIQNAVVGLFILGCIYVIFLLAVNLIPGLGQFFS